MKFLPCILLGLIVAAPAYARTCGDPDSSSPPRVVILSGGIATAVETTTMSKDAPVEADETGTQASMVITGRIMVNPDGSVRGYSLDRQGEVPSAVKQLVGEAVPDWRFKPVAGSNGPVAAQALMSLRIVARQTSTKAYTAAIQGVQFGNAAAEASNSCTSRACLSYRDIVKPEFPACELMQNVTGTVYADVEIDKDGHVAKVAVVQVDLRNSGTAAEVESWRKGFARSVLDAVHKWTFNVPVIAGQVQPKSWIVHVPVNFYTARQSVDYGHWDLYYPGPVHPPAWVNDSGGAATNESADAVPPDSGAYQPDPRFVLLTQPGGLPPPGHTGHS